MKLWKEKYRKRRTTKELVPYKDYETRSTHLSTMKNYYRTWTPISLNVQCRDSRLRKESTSSEKPLELQEVRKKVYGKQTKPTIWIWLTRAQSFWKEELDGNLLHKAVKKIEQEIADDAYAKKQTSRPQPWHRNAYSLANEIRRTQKAALQTAHGTADWFMKFYTGANTQDAGKTMCYFRDGVFWIVQRNDVGISRKLQQENHWGRTRTKDNKLSERTPPRK